MIAKRGNGFPFWRRPFVAPPLKALLSFNHLQSWTCSPIVCQRRNTMGVRKRKADDIDEYAGWVPTVPAPSTSYSGYGAASSSSSYAHKSGTGSSKNPIILDSPPLPSSSLPATKPPPAKRQRKRKDPNAPEEEKRGAIFKKKAPQNILDRVYRVMEQRYVSAI